MKNNLKLTQNYLKSLTSLGANLHSSWNHDLLYHSQNTLTYYMYIYKVSSRAISNHQSENLAIFTF